MWGCCRHSRLVWGRSKAPSYSRKDSNLFGSTWVFNTCRCLSLAFPSSEVPPCNTPGRIRKNDLTSVKGQFTNCPMKVMFYSTQPLAVTPILAGKEGRLCISLLIRIYNSTCTKACCQVKQKRHAAGMCHDHQLGEYTAGTYHYSNDLWGWGEESGNRVGSPAPCQGRWCVGGHLNFRFLEYMGLGQSSALLFFNSLEDSVSSQPSLTFVWIVCKTVRTNYWSLRQRSP